jgi:hypothetical protein
MAHMNCKQFKNSSKKRQAGWLATLTLLPALMLSTEVLSAESCGDTGISTVNITASHDAEEQPAITGSFTITRTNDLSNDIVIPFILSGSAQQGVDYENTEVNISFAAGESEKTLLITPIDDNKIEAIETVTLTLSLGIGYILSDQITNTISLTDNDI